MSVITYVSKGLQIVNKKRLTMTGENRCDSSHQNLYFPFSHFNMHKKHLYYRCNPNEVKRNDRIHIHIKNKNILIEA